MDNDELLQQIRSDVGAMERRLRDEIEKVRDEVAIVEKRLRDEMGVIEQRLASHIQNSEERLTKRIQAVEKRLEPQGGIVQAGSRPITRIVEWTDKADDEMAGLQQLFAVFEKRLGALGKRSS